MWQRIQTLWIALSGILLLLFVFQDLAVYTLPSGGSNILSAWSIREASSGASLHSSWPVGIASILSFVVSLLSIFLFRRRMLQFRIVLLNLFILVGLLVYIGAISWFFCSQNDAGFSVKVWLSFPVVGIILQYLASRRILFDEMLVRTANRLR